MDAGNISIYAHQATQTVGDIPTWLAIVIGALAVAGIVFIFRWSRNPGSKR